MFWRREEKFKLIPVLPKNYRSICLRAIELAFNPKIVVDKQAITDFSEQGKLTQEYIRNSVNFEIKDGNVSIPGFHDHAKEMWINENYQDFANYCELLGWLRIEGPAA